MVSRNHNPRFGVLDGGEYLFDAGSDRNFRVWTLQDHEYVEALEGYKLDVTGLDFDDGPNSLFSTNLVGTVLIWVQWNQGIFRIISSDSQA